MQKIIKDMPKDVREIRSCIYKFSAYGIRIIATSLITISTMALIIDLKLTIMTIIPILFTACLVVKIKNILNRILKNHKNILQNYQICSRKYR